jgi:hypothetical protein
MAIVDVDIRLIALRQSESGLSFTVDIGLRTLAELKPPFRRLSVRLRTIASGSM